jgi:hypothetical protein
VVRAGPALWHGALGAAWLSAYLFYQAWAGWFRAAPARRPRYRRPMLIYGSLTAVLGAACLAARWPLVAWAPLFGLALAVTAVEVVRRQPRSLLAGGATVALACAMAGVAFGREPWQLGWLAWTLVAWLWAYFFGTILYVKTMIRQRGRRGWLVASIAYHGLVAGLAWTGVVLAGTGWWTAAVASLLLLRSALVPLRWPGATPKQIGIGEFGATALVVSAACLM